MEWNLDEMAPFLKAFPPVVMQIDDKHTKHKAYERDFRYQPSGMLERDQLRHELTLARSLSPFGTPWDVIEEAGHMIDTTGRNLVGRTPSHLRQCNADTGP